MTSADGSAPSFADLLRSAVTKPGILSAAADQILKAGRETADEKAGS